ncbi:putative polyglutamine synthesis accessory protein [Actinomadura sp. NBRC 104412]|nr:putative polyglutamine synthesis accessory protein [Actinomadura sp. NBRC 104412]
MGTMGSVTLALCGDVMLGRGVDQILPHPGDPVLREPSVRDAREYVSLAVEANGPLPKPVPFDWPWGDALAVLRESAPDALVLNLETSVTRDGRFAPGKEIHYRMNPANLPCLAAARPDVCVLANNHVLDFDLQGLHDTLDALDSAGLRTAGAGRDARAAAAPAIVPVEGGRVLVFAFGMPSSGVDPSWAATGDRAGVAFVPEPSAAEAARLLDHVKRVKRPGDIAIASIHWGSNWGHHVPRDQVRFAHALIDGGVDVVHGHSSHHPRPIEVYRGKPILYGCGDLINDYEGIGGYEGFRDDLRLLYLATFAPGTGEPASLRMAPMQAGKMSLRRPGDEDIAWLRQTLEGSSRAFGTRVTRDPDGLLSLA